MYQQILCSLSYFGLTLVALFLIDTTDKVTPSLRVTLVAFKQMSTDAAVICGYIILKGAGFQDINAEKKKFVINPP